MQKFSIRMIGMVAASQTSFAIPLLAAEPVEPVTDINTIAGLSTNPKATFKNGDPRLVCTRFEKGGSCSLSATTYFGVPVASDVELNKRGYLVTVTIISPPNDTIIEQELIKALGEGCPINEPNRKQRLWDTPNGGVHFYRQTYGNVVYFFSYKWSDKIVVVD